MEHFLPLVLVPVARYVSWKPDCHSANCDSLSHLLSTAALPRCIVNDIDHAICDGQRDLYDSLLVNKLTSRISNGTGSEPAGNTRVPGRSVTHISGDMSAFLEGGAV